jgi:hypothetical protein
MLLNRLPLRSCRCGMHQANAPTKVGAAGLGRISRSRGRPNNAVPAQLSGMAPGKAARVGARGCRFAVGRGTV